MILLSGYKVISTDFQIFVGASFPIMISINGPNGWVPFKFAIDRKSAEEFCEELYKKDIGTEIAIYDNPSYVPEAKERCIKELQEILQLLTRVDDEERDE